MVAWWGGSLSSSLRAEATMASRPTVPSLARGRPRLRRGFVVAAFAPLAFAVVAFAATVFAGLVAAAGLLVLVVVAVLLPLPARAVVFDFMGYCLAQFLGSRDAGRRNGNAGHCRGFPINSQCKELISPGVSDACLCLAFPRRNSTWPCRGDRHCTCGQCHEGSSLWGSRPSEHFRNVEPGVRLFRATGRRTTHRGFELRSPPGWCAGRSHSRCGTGHAPFHTPCSTATHARIREALRRVEQGL